MNPDTGAVIPPGGSNNNSNANYGLPPKKDDAKEKTDLQKSWDELLKNLGLTGSGAILGAAIVAVILLRK